MWKLLDWLLKVPRPASPGQCKNCRHFSDFTDEEDDPDEVNGYCCHPFHWTKNSPHFAYGGHWTHTESGCSMFEAGAGWKAPEERSDTL